GWHPDNCVRLSTMESDCSRSRVWSYSRSIGSSSHCDCDHIYHDSSPGGGNDGASRPRSREDEIQLGPRRAAAASVLRHSYMIVSLPAGAELFQPPTIPCAV